MEPFTSTLTGTPISLAELVYSTVSVPELSRLVTVLPAGTSMSSDSAMACISPPELLRRSITRPTTPCLSREESASLNALLPSSRNCDTAR